MAYQGQKADMKRAAPVLEAPTQPYPTTVSPIEGLTPMLTTKQSISKSRRTRSGVAASRLAETRKRQNARFYSGVHQRVVAVRKALKMNVDDFAAFLGLKPSLYLRYENFKVKSGQGQWDNILRTLTQKTNVSPGWLYFCREFDTPKDERWSSKKVITKGGGPLARALGYISLPEDVSPENVKDFDALYYLQVIDDELAPEFRTGDHALCDPNADCNVGDLVVIHPVKGEVGMFAKLAGPLPPAVTLGPKSKCLEGVVRIAKDGSIRSIMGRSVASVHRIIGRYRVAVQP